METDFESLETTLTKLPTYLLGGPQIYNSLRIDANKVVHPLFKKFEG